MQEYQPPNEGLRQEHGRGTHPTEGTPEKQEAGEGEHVEEEQPKECHARTRRHALSSQVRKEGKKDD